MNDPSFVVPIDPVSTATPNAPRPLGAGMVLCVVMLTVPAFVMLLLPPVPVNAPRLGLMGWAVALVVAAAGVPLALGNARLHPAMRHLYNIHFALLVPACLFGWSVHLADVSNDSVLAQLLPGLMMGGAAAAMACLMAAACSQPRAMAAMAAMTAAVVLCLSGARGGLWPILPIIILPALFVWPSDAKAPAAGLSDAGQGFIGVACFLAMNGVILFTAGQLLWGIIAPAFEIDAGLFEIPDGFFAAMGTRWALGVVGMLIGGISPWLWPHTSVSRLGVGLGGVALALSAACGARPFTGVSVFPILCSVAALVAAGSLAAVLPRTLRWPASTIGAAVGGLVGIEWMRPLVPGPYAMLLVFMVEGSVAVLLWEVAYFTAIRRLRNASE